MKQLSPRDQAMKAIREVMTPKMLDLYFDKHGHALQDIATLVMQRTDTPEASSFFHSAAGREMFKQTVLEYLGQTHMHSPAQFRSEVEREAGISLAHPSSRSDAKYSMKECREVGLRTLEKVITPALVKTYFDPLTIREVTVLVDERTRTPETAKFFQSAPGKALFRETVAEYLLNEDMAKRPHGFVSQAERSVTPRTRIEPQSGAKVIRLHGQENSKTQGEQRKI